MFAPASSQAAPVWAEGYNGTGNGNDIPHAAIVDTQGDLIVTGQSDTTNHHLGITTLAYDPAGKQLWAHAETLHGTEGPPYTTNSFAIALDSSGDAVVTGQHFGDDHITVATYSPSGKRLNRMEIILPVAQSDINGLQLYPNGDFSLTGTTVIPSDDGDSDYTVWFVARFDSAGKRLWYDDYAGSSAPGGYDVNEIVGAAVDSSGALVVAGNQTDDAGNTTVVVRKYDPSGKVTYTSLYSDQSSSFVFASAFVMDAGGDVYVAANGFLLLKFLPSGEIAWAQGHKPGSATALILDNDGNIIAGGEAVSAPGGGSYVFQRLLVKWDSKGHQIWARESSQTANASFRVISLFAVAGSDEFYSIDDLRNYDSTRIYESSMVLASRFGSDGYVHDAQRYDGSSAYPGDAYAQGGAYDAASDSLYVIAQQEDSYSDMSGPNYDWATLKYQIGE